MKTPELVQAVRIPIAKIEPNKGQIEGLPANPRFIRDEKFKKLVKSIEDNPEMTALREVLVYPHNGKYIIIGGNMRYRAMKELGYKDAICKVLPEDTTPEQLQAYTIKDNAGFGEWDFDLLGNEWDEDLLGDWGVDIPAIQIEEEAETTSAKEVAEDDFDADAERIEPRCKTGDIWQLGTHRLMCGDSTNPEDVAALMGGEVADLVFTDPPYGMKKEADGVANDNLNFADLLEFNKKWIALSFQYLKNNGSWYCWGIDEPLMDIYSEILKPLKKASGNEKITFRNLITWTKGRGGRGVGVASMRCYCPNEEKCLFVMKGSQGYSTTKEDFWDGFEDIRQRLLKEKELSGLSIKQICEITSTYASHYFAQSQWAMITEKDWNLLRDYCQQHGLRGFCAEYDQVRAEYDQVRAEYDQVRAEWYATRAYFDNTHDNMTSVWEFPIASQKERATTGGHATPKPLALCARAIKSSSRELEKVLDLFGGSGSTLIACEQLNRACYMLELTEKYCDVILARWEKHTGQKAVRINNVKEFE